MTNVYTHVLIYCVFEVSLYLPKLHRS